jgi:hypothetical protein
MTLQNSLDSTNPSPFSTAAVLDARLPNDDIPGSFFPTGEDVAFRAYQNFQNHGAADGHDVQDWLRAETELIAEHFAGDLW